MRDRTAELVHVSIALVQSTKRSLGRSIGRSSSCTTKPAGRRRRFLITRVRRRGEGTRVGAGQWQVTALTGPRTLAGRRDARC